MSLKSFRFPRNDSKLLWTNHIVAKMRYYGISEQKIKNIVRSPERKEDGVAPKTVAVMNAVKSKSKPHEIWVMYQPASPKSKNQSSKLILISAWRYPGRSPVGKKIEIPEDVLADIKKFLRG